MKDLMHVEFSRFHHQIRLSASQKKIIHTLRESLRTRITNYFRNKLNLHPPQFFSCGRQATGTTIAPNYGETLFEEGVLLQHLDKNTVGKWPEPEGLHRLMLSAVKDHTPDPPIDRKHSICVRYRGLYKIELSIHAKSPDSTLLAVNRPGGWQPSMRKELAGWFKNQIEHQGLQLLRIARYLNAWADFHANQVNGFAWLLPLDILSARFFQADIGRDDHALARTAAAIADAAPWEIPQAGANTLPWLLSPLENRTFTHSLEVLARRSRLASTTKDRTHACAIWRSLLGDRFPMADTNPRGFEGLTGIVQQARPCFCADP